MKTIHISERDTQISNEPKREDEFVNTWSVEGFHEEGVAPAEMGWGTHEKELPKLAFTHERGPRNQICLAHPGCRTWVRSWVPCGDIVGMVIRHGEAFSISEALTVEENGEAVYRPTVHYAYCPADAAIASLHELHMRGDELQPAQRIMDDEIVDGRDELGVLLMGHPLTSWWYGSLLDIHEARRLAPHQNATTLQVAACDPRRGAVAAREPAARRAPAGRAAVRGDPRRRAAVPGADRLAAIGLDAAAALVGPVRGFGRPRPADEDVWQFSTFLVHGPALVPTLSRVDDTPYWLRGESAARGIPLDGRS